MERRGFVVATADSVAAADRRSDDQLPAFAVVDMRLGDGLASMSSAHCSKPVPAPASSC